MAKLASQKNCEVETLQPSGQTVRLLVRSAVEQVHRALLVVYVVRRVVIVEVASRFA